ncbi:MAG: hypothetical protein GX079_02875 [Tissierellia bacterium]|nr:hypothetical protein [Tissierellia bacterium]
MAKNPIQNIIIDSLVVFIIFWFLFFLEKYQLISSNSAKLYFIIALALALIDILVSTKLAKWLASLKDKDL